MIRWTYNYELQITDKITAFLSNSPIRAPADLLPFAEAAKVVAQTPEYE